MTKTYHAYATGKSLYGDDFSDGQIEDWFRDEQESYCNLTEKREPGKYGYYALNWRHGFRHLPPFPFEHVLGLGSAFGDELKPVLSRAKTVTILEPSNGFANDEFAYVKPNANGIMPFRNETFDLVTCFGVLHHIPNVSTVVREIARCMKTNGWLLLREPTHSMGNWDKPRRGLTRRERGIPLPILHRILSDAGLCTVHERRCMFSLTARIQPLLGKRTALYNTEWITALDDFASNIPIWSAHYHASNILQRFRPWAVFSVLTKASGSR